MKKLSSYFSLVKFSHTIFSLPFAVTGFFMALKETERFPDPIIIAATFLCLIFARNAAMAFNRLADRKFDKKNPRTAQREIPAGTIHPKGVLFFTIVNVVLFILSAYFINQICFILSPVAMIVILGYSYTKRVSWLCHFHLGLSLMIAPIGAYMAITGNLSMDIFILGLGVLFWVAGFDILYALQDMAFDRDTKLHSVPSAFGDAVALKISRISHVVASILLFIWWWLYYENSYLIIAGILLFVLFLIRQHLLIRKNKYDRINSVFFISNGIASLGFGIFYILNFLL